MRILILLFVTSLSFGQVNKLKPEFRNLSWIIDEKSAEVVNTLSKHYGDSNLRKDSAFVTHENYELYQDSIMLYKLTKGAFKENDPKAKSTIIGPYEDSKEKHSVAVWIKIYDKETRSTYAANKNSTVGDYACLPSTYENLKFFYAKEKDCIKSYNNGRVKLYDNKSQTSYDTINFYLAFHKTIQPIETDGVNSDGWIPFVYFYAKPKRVVYPATIQKIWESQTGLPYTAAKELQLTDDRITKILSMPKVINDEVLIKELKIDKTYDIAVSCDTCEVKLFDNHTEDNDVIDFTYKNQTTKVTIKNAGINYEVIVDQDDSFFIYAVSEGSLETCTVDALIGGKNHIFALRKGERVLIKLHKI